jgi:hypothetical protein
MAKKRKINRHQKHRNPIIPIEVKGLPDRVKVGYRDIKIKYVRPDWKKDEMTESYGEYWYRDGIIYIQHDLCGQERANTTFHEIMHAAVYVAGLNQANGPLAKDEHEELVVNQLSNFMIGVFRDNPWVLDMLKNHLNEID